MYEHAQAAFSSFAWDENKRQKNLAKHGIDFPDAAQALKRPRLEHRSDKNGEVRIQAVCPSLSPEYITVVYTMRGDICRIISARAAHINERRRYQDVLGRRSD
ncbi:BrnT family toxin [Pararhizobium sp. YC-54]|uniref:BrnT family toxin n=1 Tax=Pararhizobium sp. YC-54 TaxID=2986920 RepID=UPI0021F776D4|nr:BrnT family toxin [Pararhizobium sp. YC-54]MCV9999966.1 BrnT family toxin [Pararhizobium sp. YC-54]